MACETWCEQLHAYEAHIFKGVVSDWTKRVRSSSKWKDISMPT